jgi:hypothetical protein
MGCYFRESMIIDNDTILNLKRQRDFSRSATHLQRGIVAQLTLVKVRRTGKVR